MHIFVVLTLSAKDSQGTEAHQILEDAHEESGGMQAGPGASKGCIFKYESGCGSQDGCLVKI